MTTPKPPPPNLLGAITDEDKEFQASLMRNRAEIGCYRMRATKTPRQRRLAIVSAPLLTFVFFSISARAQRLNDFGHLEVELSLDDPQMYTKPFTTKFTEDLLASSDIFFCDENEKDRAHIEQR